MSLLDASGSLISNAHRHLGDTLVGVDHLLEVVPNQAALNRDEVLHRPHTGKAAQTIHVLLHPLLSEAQHLVGDLLEAARQDAAGLQAWRAPGLLDGCAAQP